MTSLALLSTQLDEAYQRIRARVDGLTSEEFWWEPAPGCWTIERRPDGRWWVYYPELPHPDPGPLTTIGWRLVHDAESKIMYHEYAFGDARLVWDDIDSAHAPEAAIRQLDEGHALLRADLDGLTEEDLGRDRLTNWGEPWPTWKIFWAMIDHDIHHGAEIGALRDLYRVTNVAPAAPAAAS
jgi:hypothetical protein